jgi:hypothetical protein
MLIRMQGALGRCTTALAFGLFLACLVPVACSSDTSVAPDNRAKVKEVLAEGDQPEPPAKGKRGGRMAETKSFKGRVIDKGQ